MTPSVPLTSGTLRAAEEITRLGPKHVEKDWFRKLGRLTFLFTWKRAGSKERHEGRRVIRVVVVAEVGRAD